MAGPAGAARAVRPAGTVPVAAPADLRRREPGRPPRVVVIGVGNPMRHDDGAGIAVVERARPLLPPTVAVRTLRGEATSLLDAWAEADLAVVVDAVRWNHYPPSGVARIDAIAEADDIQAWGGGTSSHGLGVAEAVALGRALDRLPPQLVLILVTLVEGGHGEGLSPTVERYVERAVTQLIGEVRAATA